MTQQQQLRLIGQCGLCDIVAGAALIEGPRNKERDLPCDRLGAAYGLRRIERASSGRACAGPNRGDEGRRGDPRSRDRIVDVQRSRRTRGDAQGGS